MTSPADDGTPKYRPPARNERWLVLKVHDDGALKTIVERPVVVDNCRTAFEAVHESNLGGLTECLAFIYPPEAEMSKDELEAMRALAGGPKPPGMSRKKRSRSVVEEKPEDRSKARRVKRRHK